MNVVLPWLNTSSSMTGNGILMVNHIYTYIYIYKMVYHNHSIYIFHYHIYIYIYIYIINIYTPPIYLWWWLMVAPAAGQLVFAKYQEGWYLANVIRCSAWTVWTLEPGADFLLVLSREWMGTREWGYYSEILDDISSWYGYIYIMLSSQ